MNSSKLTLCFCFIKTTLTSAQSIQTIHFSEPKITVAIKAAVKAVKVIFDVLDHGNCHLCFLPLGQFFIHLYHIRKKNASVFFRHSHKKSPKSIAFGADTPFRKTN